MAFRRFPARPHELARRDTHDKRYLLADRQGPAYAEIVLVRIFRRFDWHAVWIDTYRKGVCWEGMPYESESSKLPEEQQRLYNKVRAANGGTRSGAWDIWAWKGKANLFVEAKMGGHDIIQPSQVKWFKAATARAGFSRRSFCVAEWYLDGVA